MMIINYHYVVVVKLYRLTCGELVFTHKYYLKYKF